MPFFSRTKDKSEKPEKPAPDLPGLPGAIVRGARKFRRATNVLPPLGIGLGAGIGVGCGFGWPVRNAYGPPRGLCGPAIGVGIGVGYGQGFGRRFGRDDRSITLKESIESFEQTVDALFVRFLVLIGRRKPEPVTQGLPHLTGSRDQALVAQMRSVRR